MNFTSVWGLLKETFSEWSEDKASRLAAALAYYTIFSIAPLLVITVAIAGLVFGREAASGGINQQITGLVGQEGGRAIQQMVASAGKNQSGGILAGVLGLGALLLGATGVFTELHDALNTIWEIEPKPKSSILAWFKDRFLSFTMVLGIGFLLLVSLVVSAAISAMTSAFNALPAGAEILAHAVDLVVSMAIFTLLFAMMYKVLPDVEIRWRDVWIGSIGTAGLFAMGKFLIGLYLGASSVASSYGAAGALVVVLVWVYYSAQILFFGAEFTQVYARRYGSRILPAADAVAVTGEIRLQQGTARRNGTTQAKAPATSGSPAHGTVPASSLATVLAGVLIGLTIRVLRGSPR